MTELAGRHRQRSPRLAFPAARGVVGGSLQVLNTLPWCCTLFLFALVKLVVPAARVRAEVDRILNSIATTWVAGNRA
ncbi:MAG: hypothetical protein ACM338_12235 [Betaproteobacteria bacterium]